MSNDFVLCPHYHCVRMKDKVVFRSVSFYLVAKIESHFYAAIRYDFLLLIFWGQKELPKSNKI